MMPEMCVIYGSNTTRNVKEGIYIHDIPYLDEKKEIIAEFVRGTRANWKPAGRSLRSVFMKAFRIVTEISTRKILQIDS